MAKIVWAFDITPGAGVVDDSVVTNYSGGFVIGPLKFPLRLKPRSAEHIKVIEKEYVAADTYLRQFED